MLIMSDINDIAERAKASGFSMAAVCRQAGVAQSTPSRVRKGCWEPKPRTVRKLSAALEELVAAKPLAEAE